MATVGGESLNNLRRETVVNPREAQRRGSLTTLTLDLHLRLMILLQ